MAVLLRLWRAIQEYTLAMPDSADGPAINERAPRRIAQVSNGNEHPAKFQPVIGRARKFADPVM